MAERDDLGQIKFWQILITLGVIVILGFDLLSPQLVKVQLKDKAENMAIQESQQFVKSGSQYNEKYYAVCTSIRKQLADYGATLLPGPNDATSDPETLCPDVGEDGRIRFTVEKKAQTLLLGRLGLKNYYLVKVEVNEKFSA